MLQLPHSHGWLHCSSISQGLPPQAQAPWSTGANTEPTPALKRVRGPGLEGCCPSTLACFLSNGRFHFLTAA